MWPFRKKKPVSKAKKAVERLVTGLVIGSAIGTIIGKSLMEDDDEKSE